MKENKKRGVSRKLKRSSTGGVKVKVKVKVKWREELTLNSQANSVEGGFASIWR